LARSKNIIMKNGTSRAHNSQPSAATAALHASFLRRLNSVDTFQLYGKLWLQIFQERRHPFDVNANEQAVLKVFTCAPIQELSSEPASL
jgi:hypothetical protein